MIQKVKSGSLALRIRQGLCMLGGALLLGLLLSQRTWDRLLDMSAFMPHGHCYLWKPGLVWLHVVSDSLIGLSYASIPITLLYFVRKRKDLPFHGMFLAFGAFIVACGATHFMEVWTLWTPVYWLSGAVKAFTALASIVTAISLVQLMPRALMLPSTADLEREIVERKRVQRELENANVQLEREVRERERVQGEREELLVREQKARSDAETASRLKDDFLATVSHELRTPLQAILGWTHLLSQVKLCSQDATRAVGIIDRNAKAQAQIVNDILDVSRIVSGKLCLRLQPIDLCSIIKDAVDTLRPAAGAKGVSLAQDLDRQFEQVLGDASRLQQILWNLLSNAIRFTPKSGCVQISLRHNQGYAQVTVSDTGQGIGPEFLPHVFERFSQADSSSTRPHGGLGLGLAVVRHLVELHGGSVAAESAGKDQGATFTVRLPLMATTEAGGSASEPLLAERSPQSIETLHRDDLPSLTGLRVLVVDDEPDMRELLTIVLVEHGADVKTAGSVIEALAEFEQERPDVLLADIGMPVEDGYTLIRTLRARAPEHGGNVPAAALTAYAKVEDRMAALSAGFQTHIPKPVDLSQVVVIVASLAGRLVAPSQRIFGS